MLFIVTAKTVRFMDKGKVRRVRRSKLPAGSMFALKKPPVTKGGFRWGNADAAEAEALKIEGGQK